MLPLKEAEDRPLLLLLEGLIGVGKTTATLSIAEIMGLVPLLEPVNTNPYLSDFYAAVQAGGTRARVRESFEQVMHQAFPDMPPHMAPSMDYTIEAVLNALDEQKLTASLVPAFMQLHLLTKRFQLYQAAVHGMPIAKALGHPAKGAILDRSLAGDTVFAKMNASVGNIAPREFESYFGHWQVMQNFLPYAHAMIFLRVTPEEAKDRCDSRARPEETKRSGGFPLDYMKSLASSYDELVDWAEKRMRVIEINYNDPIRPVSLGDVTDHYPLLVGSLRRRGLSDPLNWPKVLPRHEAERLVAKIKKQLPEPGFWDRAASMEIG